MTFSPEQLNFFKFSAVVLDEFPVALRQVFISMWDNLVAGHGAPKWDDSVAVRNLFLAKEGGKTKYVPTGKSIKEWDCTALFEATIFAKTFSKPDGTGKLCTLKELYAKYLPSGAFHLSVVSPSGNQVETYGLALDQLRLLRNTLCHQISTREIDKVTFDNYIILAKDAFTALGQNTTRIDEIGKLAEEDFPTARLQQVEDELKKEKGAAIKVQQIEDHLKKIESQVEDVGSDLKDVTTGVTDVRTQVEDVKTEVIDVKTQVKEVGSDVKDMKTGATDVKTQLRVVVSDVKDVNIEVTDVKTQVKDVGSDVKDVKTGVTDVKTQVQNVGSDVEDVKTEVADVKTQVEDVGSDVKDVKTEVADVKTQVEDVRSDLKELKANFAHIQQPMQEDGSKGPLFPYTCVPDKIPHFIGRQKECQVILDHLTNGGTRLVDVWGPPGFGKSSVAISVAHQLQEMEIPVFFTSLRGMTRKDDLVSKLLSMFADAQQAFHVSPSHWLIQCLQQLRIPFVLVLDNADDLLESGDAKLKEDMLRFSEEILTQCSHIKLLFTTRESLDYLSHKIPIHNERVGVLDVAPSISLVQSLLPNVSDDNCSTIVGVCGQVPLAMELMCSIMREENVSLNELLEELTILPIVEVLNSESFPEDARLKTIINKSFERLTGHERTTFVSLVVFPGSFAIEEATAVVDLKTVRQTKKVIRSLERKSLVDCSEDFSTFTIHSLLRSFIDERRTTDKETEATFLAAQHRFYSHHISRFEMANEKFLTGQSNEALVAFLNHRDGIVLSLINGPRDEELYPKAVEVLSKAELFLFALLPDEESLFKTIYDIAVREAKKRQEVNDEGKLLAAKSFSHWGWFSSDHQALDDSFPVGLTDSAGCPTKLLCYFSIYQLLCGKLDEGISSLQCAVDSLSSSCDEIVLKQLVYDVLVISYRKKEEHKMASHFSDLHRIMAKASLVYVGIGLPNEMSSSLSDNIFCLNVTANLLSLLLSERKTPNPGFLHAVGAISKLIYNVRLESPLDVFSPERMEPFWKDIAPIMRLNVNELKEQLSIPTNVAIAVESWFNAIDDLLHPSSTTLFSFNQAAEMTSILSEIISSVVETKHREIIVSLLTTFGAAIQLAKEMLWRCAKLSTEDEIDVDFEALARTCDIFGNVLYFLNDYSGAIESHQYAIKVREENIGDHVDTSTSLTSIGCANFEMSNEIDGVKSFQSAFELREQLGIYDHVDTADIYYTLGDKYVALGNYEKGIEAHLQALELRKKHLGDHPLTGESLLKIAEVYYKKGIHSATSYCKPLEKFLHVVSYEEALTFCQQALAMRLELVEEHVDTAKSFHVLGCIHYQIGDMSSAVEAFQIASDMRSTLLGDHTDTVDTYRWLGLAKCGMEDHKGALESLQKALQLGRKLSIRDQPGIADITSNMGEVYHKMGDYHSAREQFQDAVDLYKKLLDKHKSTANSYHNLAITHLAMGGYPEALECFKQASTMRLEVLGQHIHTANSFHMLGVVHHKMSDFASAVEAFQIASDMRSTLLGDHPDMASSYHCVGLALLYTGDLEGALESLQKALKLGKRLLDYPDMADIINDLGCVHFEMGDYQSAREQFQYAVDLNKKFRGKHANTANSCHNLASTYLHLGSYPEALDLCQQALSMRLELLGHNEQTLNSLETLQCIHLKMGNICSAVKAFCKASDIKCNRLGDSEEAGSYWKGWKCSIS